RVLTMPRLLLLLIVLLMVSVFLVSNFAPPESALGQQPAGNTWKGSGKNGAVACGGQPGVDGGLEILKSGGTAADAAVTAILMMCITDAQIVSFGGEVPILFYDSKRKVVEVLCGQGEAPRLATREYFAKKKGIPMNGLENASIPGTLDACLTLMDRYGTKTF